MYHVVSWQRVSIATLINWSPQLASKKWRHFYVQQVLPLCHQAFPMLCSLCITGQCQGLLLRKDDTGSLALGREWGGSSLIHWTLVPQLSIPLWEGRDNHWSLWLRAHVLFLFFLDSSSQRFCQSSDLLI